MHANQGGILFLLRGSLRDRPAISPQFALIKNKINLKSVYFLKFTWNYPNKQELVLIDRKTRQPF